GRQEEDQVVAAASRSPAGCRSCDAALVPAAAGHAHHCPRLRRGGRSPAGSFVDAQQYRVNVERLLDGWEPHARPHPTPGLRPLLRPPLTTRRPARPDVCPPLAVRPPRAGRTGSGCAVRATVEPARSVPWTAGTHERRGPRGPA